QDPARARLARRPQGVLQGLRQGRPGHAHEELRGRDGAARRQVSGRRRGEDFLRPRPERDVRPQVDGPAHEGHQDPGADRQEVPGPSGRHALPLIDTSPPPPTAQRGTPAANKYAKIAPAAPHAQHMPSHIYSMVGMWEESVTSNWRSVLVANEYVAKAKLDGTLGGVPHAY